MKRSVFLTGATGFIGEKLLRRLRVDGGVVTAAVRRDSASAKTVVPPLFLFNNLSSDQSWLDGVVGHDVVVHCAALAHMMRATPEDIAVNFKETNLHGTIQLARESADLGIRRFVFISSIKVNGESTSIGQRYQEDDAPEPEDPYGLSKLEAERELMELSARTGMEVVIIRPPLVYGPGVKGNFATMIKLVEKGLPLPLGAVHNKRSLVGIDNLVELIIRCIDHPKAANQVFLAGDGVDLSTTELLRGVGEAMGKPARLIPFPAGLLQFGATVLGKKAIAQRLLGSLQVDISKACEMLDWTPPYTVEEGLRRCFEKSK